jgi:hypothetical protein
VTMTARATTEIHGLAPCGQARRERSSATASDADLAEVIARVRSDVERNVKSWADDLLALCDAAKQSESLRNMMPPHEHEQICEALREECARVKDLNDSAYEQAKVDLDRIRTLELECARLREDVAVERVVRIGAERERDSLREAIGREKEGRWVDVTRLERERDEECARLRESKAYYLECMRAQSRGAERLERERDEARAEVERLTAQLAELNWIHAPCRRCGYARHENFQGKVCRFEGCDFPDATSSTPTPQPSGESTPAEKPK